MYIRHRDREHHWSGERGFSHTPRRLAAEDPENVVAQLASSPIMKQIADKPEALRAFQELALVIKDSSTFCVRGSSFACLTHPCETEVDLVPGKQPSMVDMMRLATNQKFRDGVRNVVEELRKAGIEINKDVRRLARILCSSRC